MTTFRFRLADKDRERLGIGDEWLDIDIFSVTAWEAALMQRGFTRDGLSVSFDSPRQWRQALVGKPGEDGKRRPDWGAELMTVWLLLRRAGIDVPMAEVDYDADGMSWDIVMEPAAAGEDEVPGESEGKDDAASPSESGSLQTSMP